MRDVCLRGCTPFPPVDKILDTRLWKHYLSATTVADDNNCWKNSKKTSYATWWFYCRRIFNGCVVKWKKHKCVTQDESCVKLDLVQFQEPSKPVQREVPLIQPAQPRKHKLPQPNCTGILVYACRGVFTLSLSRRECEIFSLLVTTNLFEQQI